MRRIEIDNINHRSYDKFETLYKSSFPIFEQRTYEQQEEAFKNKNYHLQGYEDENGFAGFISYWEFDSYIYIEHFAISREIRGKGYGSSVLKDFIESTHKTVLLEIDPIEDEISEARLRFYKRCGFYENPYPHKHPAYREEYQPHSLIVLTTKRPISEKEYECFNSDLSAVVMKR